MKKIAILQSNYIPWKGYFDLINSVDDFVIYDTAQYTKNDWRNRNKIKTSHGVQWLTIPILAKKNSGQQINEALVSDHKWRKKHWAAISQAYSKSSYYHEFRDEFKEIYIEGSEVELSEINFRFINKINDILGISTRIHWSSDFSLVEGKSKRLVEICKDLNADVYLSGPSAKEYLDQELFDNEKIIIEWMDYNCYPEYHQKNGSFEHGVSILDLIFNEGPNSTYYMKSFR